MSRRLHATLTGLMLTLTCSVSMAEVVVVVSQQSPITSISSADLADIYLGRLRQLPPGRPIVPIDQAESSPQHGEFYTTFLQRSAAEIKAHWSRLIFIGRGSPPRALRNSAAVAKLVAENPNAIAYISPSDLNDQLRVVTIE